MTFKESKFTDTRSRRSAPAVHSTLFFRKIVEMERFALRAAILHECQNYLLTVRSAISQRSHEKIGDCDHVNILGPTRKRWGRGEGRERKTGGFSHCPSPPPPSFSSLTTVQLSRGCISYLTSHKRKNSPKKPAAKRASIASPIKFDRTEHKNFSKSQINNAIYRLKRCIKSGILPKVSYARHPVGNLMHKHLRIEYDLKGKVSTTNMYKV